MTTKRKQRSLISINTTNGHHVTSPRKKRIVEEKQSSDDVVRQSGRERNEIGSSPSPVTSPPPSDPFVSTARHHLPNEAVKSSTEIPKLPRELANGSFSVDPVPSVTPYVAGNKTVVENNRNSEASSSPSKLEIRNDSSHSSNEPSYPSSNKEERLLELQTNKPVSRSLRLLMKFLIFVVGFAVMVFSFEMGARSHIMAGHVVWVNPIMFERCDAVLERAQQDLDVCYEKLQVSEDEAMNIVNEYNKQREELANANAQLHGASESRATLERNLAERNEAKSTCHDRLQQSENEISQLSNKIEQYKLLSLNCQSDLEMALAQTTKLQHDLHTQQEAAVEAINSVSTLSSKRYKTAERQAAKLRRELNDLHEAAANALNSVVQAAYAECKPNGEQ